MCEKCKQFVKDCGLDTPPRITQARIRLGPVSRETKGRNNINLTT